MNQATAASFPKSLSIIAYFELYRAFQTTRGLVSLVTFGFVWYLILRYPILAAADFIIENEGNEMNYALLEQFGFGQVLQWRIAEFAVYWQFAQFLFPMLCIVLTADQTVSDRERGSLRYLSLRCSRDGIFYGRFLGQVLIQGILIIITLISTLVIVLMRSTDYSLLGDGINSCLTIFIKLLILLLPFTALMALLSTTTQSARQATLWAMISLLILPSLLKGLSAYLPFTSMLMLLIPGAQLTDLAQYTGVDFLRQEYAGIIVPLLQAVVLLAVGRSIMAKGAL